MGIIFDDVSIVSPPDVDTPNLPPTTQTRKSSPNVEKDFLWVYLCAAHQKGAFFTDNKQYHEELTRKTGDLIAPLQIIPKNRSSGKSVKDLVMYFSTFEENQRVLSELPQADAIKITEGKFDRKHTSQVVKKFRRNVLQKLALDDTSELGYYAFQELYVHPLIDILTKQEARENMLSDNSGHTYFSSNSMNELPDEFSADEYIPLQPDETVDDDLVFELWDVTHSIEKYVIFAPFEGVQNTYTDFYDSLKRSDATIEEIEFYANIMGSKGRENMPDVRKDLDMSLDYLVRAQQS